MTPHVSISALCLNMKLLILAIAAISTVSASKAVTCDECQAAVTDLVARLLSEESIAEQVAILKLTVCPQLPTLTARVPWTCGSPTWPAASTTTSCWSRTCAVSSSASATRRARRCSCWSVSATGPARSALTSWPGPLTTWPKRRLLPRVSPTSRETASVVRTVTPRTVAPWCPLCCPWPCLCSEPLSWSSPLSSARRWSVSVKCFDEIHFVDEKKKK